MVRSLPIVPPPRRPLDPAAPSDSAAPIDSAVPAVPDDSVVPADRIRGWYENELGWATVPGEPVRLSVGVRFDVLDVPAEAGRAALRHLPPGAPVALRGDRMRLLVAAGSAEELPAILRWLEWEPLPLDLSARGTGDAMEAPSPPDLTGPPSPSGAGGAVRSPGLAAASQGAAVWLRPPVAGCEVEVLLPTVSALGGGGGAPDLVRLVNTLATHCHRVRLRRACAQPLAFS
ncbi:SCO3374 family protein [Streptomyces sp. NPDC002328]|uniref:SCO3374 family protein n=1 Tax=Streptomyces sp. NPDC002328 TaxID=3364642 RepID=UPI0036C6C035